jgi:hypothetical protein
VPRATNDADIVAEFLSQRSRVSNDRRGLEVGSLSLKSRSDQRLAGVDLGDEAEK